VGVEPYRFTLRQLDWMATAKDRNNWDHTAVILAKLHNQWAKTARSAKSFHPYHQPSPADNKPFQLTPQQTVSLLKSILIPRS
jgi:hypothetical protein